MRYLVKIDGDRISKAISLERAERLRERAQRNNPAKHVTVEAA